MTLATVVAGVCRHRGLSGDALTGGGRRTAIQQARARIACCWVAVLGHPGRPLAVVPGVSPQAVYQAVARGREARAAWERLLKRSVV